MRKLLIALLFIPLMGCAVALERGATAAKVAVLASPDAHMRLTADVTAAKAVAPADDALAHQCYDYVLDWLGKNKPVVVEDTDAETGVVYAYQRARNVRRGALTAGISEEFVAACGGLAMSSQAAIQNLALRLGIPIDLP